MDLSALVKAPTSNQARGDYSTYMGTTKSPLDFYNTAVNDLGVPEARAAVAADRKAINDTQNLIDAVDPAVQGRTSRSNVTQAQRQGLITKEKTPLLTSLNRLGGQYSTSSGNLADLMGQASMQGTLGYQGQQDIFTQLYNRWTMAQQEEEAARLAKAQAESDAWIQSLMDSIGALDSQIASMGNNPFTEILDNSANWAALNTPLKVTSNYGLQSNNVSPQTTWNPQNNNYNPTATFNPQQQYTGNINMGAGSGLSGLSVGAGNTRTNRISGVDDSGTKHRISGVSRAY